MFWGITRHPELKTKPDVTHGQAGRILGGTIEALAHELVFATQFEQANRDDNDTIEVYFYKVFLVTVLLAHRDREDLNGLFREMDKCLHRAMNTEEIRTKAFTARIQLAFEVLVKGFGISQKAPGKPLSSAIDSLLVTGREFCPGAQWDATNPEDAKPIGGTDVMMSRGTVFTARVGSRPLRLEELSLETVAETLFDLLSARLQHIQLELARGSGDARVDLREELDPFYSHGLRPKNVTSAALRDVLSSEDSSNGLTHRVARLVAWIHLAELCRCMGNFATFAAICQALYSPPLLRLDRLWRLVPKVDQQTMSTWESLAGDSRAGTLPFHTPVVPPSYTTATIPFLGSVLPGEGQKQSEALASWDSLAEALVSLDRTRSDVATLGNQNQAVRTFVISIYEKSSNPPEPMSYWMVRSREIQLPALSESTSRSWSRAEGRSMSALQPLLYTTPLPINTLFATGSNLHEASTAALARPETRRPPSLLDTGRSARRISLPSRRSSMSENSSQKLREGETAKSEGIGNAVRRITGQLHNATIRITEEIELQVVEPEGASAHTLPLSRTNSRARSSLALDRTSRLGSTAYLPVTIKYASTERLIDLLVCGIEGDSLGSDDNGQMPLHFAYARKFAMDLDIYRRTFFATYRSFLEPTLLFEVSSLSTKKYRKGTY